MNSITKSILIFSLASSFLTLNLSSSWAKPRIALYAAHGGSEPGLKSGSYWEKDWNLKVALALQKAFETAGFEVVMIRKGDQYSAPEKWINQINTSMASAAIVVHADREWTGKISGPLLVVEPPIHVDASDANSVQKWGAVSMAQYRSSLKLARAIGQKLGINLALNNLSDSKTQAGEAVSPEGRIFCVPHESLRWLAMPSVVLTPLFMTSAQDVKTMNRQDHLQDFAERTVEGTMEYLQINP